jgi:SAM-dependent methyltransferase
MSAIRTLNLGAGPDPGGTARAGAVTVDRRPAAGVDVAADPRRLPFPDGVFLEIHVALVVERFADPYTVLDEIHRVLRHTGRVEVRVPSPWSVWGQLDRSKAFPADLRLWRDVLGGYFDRVELVSEGALYRDNALLRGIARALIRVLRWHELAEMWRFDCREKLPLPQRKSVPWSLEDPR